MPEVDRRKVLGGLAAAAAALALPPGAALAEFAPATEVITNGAVLRDMRAWYHLAINLADGAITKVGVNGNETRCNTADIRRLTRAALDILGLEPSGPRDGTLAFWIMGEKYVAEFMYVTDQVLDASAFGHANPETGSWMPKQLKGWHNGNGFYIANAVRCRRDPAALDDVLVRGA